jgi:acyl-CoA reductase-like NAD-dependent aldehyde dehydrogenase
MPSTVQIVTPVDGSIFAERTTTSDDALRVGITRARRAQAEWRSTSVEHRALLVGAFVDAMLAMGEEIVPELAWQMGRPVASGAGELRGFEERSRHMISLAADALADVRPDAEPGFDRFIVREPLGLVLVVAPWNYPFLTAVNSVVPALMAGNAVLLKHASQTLLVGERFQTAAQRAGLPDGLFQNLVLTHAQTNDLLAAGAIDQVNFTGSVPAGRSIEQAAAGTFAGVGLELGGKDPAYVRHDADLGNAVENIVDGAFFNSGQSCCGIERVYVHRSLFDGFVDGAAELVARYELGDPLDPATTLGPMVNDRAADAVRRQTGQAIEAGARGLVDAAAFERSIEGSPYLAPQVLVGVDHSMSVMRDESFGPVVGIMPVDSDEHAVGLMNDSEFGLTASIWTRDVDAVRSIGPRIEAGTVFMNRADYLDPGLAWTGVKDSGRGITLSTLGYSTLTQAKSYHLRLPSDR